MPSTFSCGGVAYGGFVKTRISRFTCACSSLNRRLIADASRRTSMYSSGSVCARPASYSGVSGRARQPRRARAPTSLALEVHQPLDREFRRHRRVLHRRTRPARREAFAARGCRGRRRSAGAAGQPVAQPGRLWTICAGRVLRTRAPRRSSTQLREARDETGCIHSEIVAATRRGVNAQSRDTLVAGCDSRRASGSCGTGRAGCEIAASPFSNSQNWRCRTLSPSRGDVRVKQPATCSRRETPARCEARRQPPAARASEVSRPVRPARTTER